MSNGNCLREIYCPNCGQDERFKISGTCMFDVTDNGAEPHGDIEWDGESYCVCPECDRYGRLKEFHVKAPTEVTS